MPRGFAEATKVGRHKGKKGGTRFPTREFRCAVRSTRWKARATRAAKRRNETHSAATKVGPYTSN